jgi:hypothetical protein
MVATFISQLSKSIYPLNYTASLRRRRSTSSKPQIPHSNKPGSPASTKPYTGLHVQFSTFIKAELGEVFLSNSVFPFHHYFSSLAYPFIPKSPMLYIRGKCHSSYKNSSKKTNNSHHYKSTVEILNTKHLSTYTQCCCY